MGRKQTISRELTSDSLVLSQRRGMGRGFFRAMLVIAIAAAAGYAAYQYDWQLERDAAAERLAYLERENGELRQAAAALRDALNAAQLDVEVERATRAELERQIATAGEQLKQAREELEFIKTAGDEASKETAKR